MSDELARFVLDYLHEEDISQRELARRARVAHTTIRAIIQGKDASETTLQRLASATGVDAHFLFRLAGYLPRKDWSDVDPRIRHLAMRCEELPPPLRETVIKVTETLIDGLEESLSNPIPGEYGILESDDERDHD